MASENRPRINKAKGTPYPNRLLELAEDDAIKVQRAGFFEALGRAIATWQMVEDGIYNVYSAATHALRPGAEAAAFAAVQNFLIKLSMADFAVRFAALEGGVDLATWAKLRERSNKKYDRVNAFKHFAAYQEFDPKSENDRIYLQPRLMDFRHLIKGKPQPTFRSTEIKEISEIFYRLGMDLAAFARTIPEPPLRP